MAAVHLFHAFVSAVARPLLIPSQVVPPAPPPVMKHRSKAATHGTSRRAQCTHMTMHRIHGNHACHQCGKIPNSGWLYHCRQDWLLEHQNSLATFADSAIVVPDESDYFDVMARYASSLKMSPSVIRQIRAGQYTLDKVEKLVAHKEHLISTIKQFESKSADSTPTTQSNSSSHESAISNIIATLGTAATSSNHPQPCSDRSSSAQGDTRASTSDNGATAIARKFPPTNAEPCRYVACHECRPYLADRIYVNIETIFKELQPPITEEEERTLWVRDSRVVRNLGLRQPPSAIFRSPRRLERSESVDIGTLQLRDSTYEDDTPLDWTTSSNSSMFDESAEELLVIDPYPCPGPGVCPVYSRNSGCAYENQEFDYGQRALNHGFSVPDEAHVGSEVEQVTPHHPRARLPRLGEGTSGSPGSTSSSGSSISLPTPTTVSLTMETLDTSLVHSSENDLRDVLPRQKAGKAATVSGVPSPSMDFDNDTISLGTCASGKGSEDSFSEVELGSKVALR